MKTLLFRSLILSFFFRASKTIYFPPPSGCNCSTFIPQNYVDDVPESICFGFCKHMGCLLKHLVFLVYWGLWMHVFLIFLPRPDLGLRSFQGPGCSKNFWISLLLLGHLWKEHPKGHHLCRILVHFSLPETILKCKHNKEYRITFGLGNVRGKICLEIINLIMTDKVILVLQILVLSAIRTFFITNQNINNTHIFANDGTE